MDPIIDPPIDATEGARDGGAKKRVPVAAPTEASIVAYLKEKNPLGLGEGAIQITDIDPPRFSGHFNFLVEGAGGKAVLRLKGPEWGSPLNGIENEYNILQFVERFEVAPKALFFDMNGIAGAPVMLLEYLEGRLYTDLTEDEQQQLLPSIGSLVAEINMIPVEAEVLPFDYPLTSYAPHREKWWRRVEEAGKDPRLEQFAGDGQAVLGRAEPLLEKYEPFLKGVIDRGDACFVFVSSHASHLMVTDKGLRFINWEAVRYGDPAFTLSVFLSSIRAASYFDAAQRALISRYLEERPVSDFEPLVRQRLMERAVSDYTWLLWMESKKLPSEEINIEQLSAWYERAAAAVIAS